MFTYYVFCGISFSTGFFNLVVGRFKKFALWSFNVMKLLPVLLTLIWVGERGVRAKFGIPYSPQSPDIGENSNKGISDFQISGQSLIKGNCHNSRTSDDIDTKPGPVTKLDKRNKATSKNLMMTSFWKIVMSLSFFKFTANLEQSGSQILDA